MPFHREAPGGESAHAGNAAHQIGQAPATPAEKEMVVLPRRGLVVRNRPRNLHEPDPPFLEQPPERPIDGGDPQRGTRVLPGLPDFRGSERAIGAQDHTGQRALLLGGVRHGPTIAPGIMISKYQFSASAFVLATSGLSAQPFRFRRVALLMKLFGLLLLIGLSLAGCSTLDTHVEPNANLGRFKHIYVQQSLNDNHGLDALIVKDLRARGFQAESGPLTLMPRDVKVYLLYEDHWDWDFTEYLISLGLSLRDATTDRLLASVRYFRPTAFMKTPDFMVHTVVDGLLNPSPKSNPPAASAPETPDAKKGRGRNQD